MERQKSADIWIAGVLTTGITIYSAWKLIGEGILSWHFSQQGFRFMMMESFCFWLMLILLFQKGRGMIIRLGAAAFLVAAFSWIHMIFLPVVFTGAYSLYLILLGRWMGRKMRRHMGVCWSFLFGSAMTVLAFCLLSLAGLGGIGKLRVWVLATGLALLFWEARNRQGGGMFQNLCIYSRDVAGSPQWPHALSAAMAAAALSLLLLQAGRLNVAVDFDSLWYGVRSHVMLDSGSGIYENLGTLGVVYTYPKGWETLTLPLAGLPSYSFCTSMNLWVAGFMLLALYQTASLGMDKKTALWVPFLTASVPGVMNMSGTAKADMMTLFCQILMVQAIFQYEKGKNGEWILFGLAAGAISLAMKPTAVVFSTAVAGIGAVWALGEPMTMARRKGSFKGQARPGAGRAQEGPEKHKKHRKLDCHAWLFLAVSIAALAGVWGRTLHLVGVPVTSVFYQFFQKLGFQVKYPFYAAGFPSAGNGTDIGGRALFLSRRLYGLLLNPQGEDMAHVIIAWGSVLPLAFFLLPFCYRILAGKGAEGGKGCLPFLSMLLAALLFIDMASLYSLPQIDGNYYMLSYVLIILAGCIWINQKKYRQWKLVAAILMPVWCYGALLCGLTNWAWALGNGGIHLANKGYYPHLQEARDSRAAQGSAAIWDIFASNPKARVIALGEHPGVLTFPCWVQSYVDISGYWGNPEIVADAPNFREYLQYADVDYLYMEKGYIDSSVRIYQIIRTLVREGWLKDVREENGNLILSVSAEGVRCPLEEAEKNLSVFEEGYVQHP